MPFSRERLQASKRPLILAGHGIRVAKQVQRFRKLIDDFNIPVVTTQLARDLMSYDDRLYMGSPGVKGDRPGGFAIQNCDLLLILGCSLHSTTTGYEKHLFAPQAHKIWVDIDHHVLEKKEPVHEKINLSIKDFLTLLEKEPLRLTHIGEWIANLQRCKSTFDIRNEKKEESDTIDYYDVIHALSDLAAEDDIIVADAGSAFYITGQAWRTKAHQRVILPGGLAQMGYATSALIGACFAAPQARVLGIIGDGSIQSNIHDLAVISHHRLNAKIFVLNNNGYACIRNTQDAYFQGHHSGTCREDGVKFPSLKKICNAYEINYGWYRGNHHKTEKWFHIYNHHLSNKNPCVIEIHTNPNQQIIPRVQSQRMPDGSMKSKGLDEMYPYVESL